MASANPIAETFSNEESSAAHGAMPSVKLAALIEAHRGVDAAWAAAVDEHERLQRAFDAASPKDVLVPCFLGGAFSFVLGADFCRDHIAEAYAGQRRAVRQLAKLDAELAANVAAVLDAKEAENLALVDRMEEEEAARQENFGLASATRRENEALATEREAFRALLAYRPAVLPDVAARFAYITGEGAPWANCVASEEEIDLLVGSMMGGIAH